MKSTKSLQGRHVSNPNHVMSDDDDLITSDDIIFPDKLAKFPKKMLKSKINSKMEFLFTGCIAFSGTF